MAARLEPLYDRILVERCEAESTSASGLVLLESSKEKPSQGYVRAIGQGRIKENGEVAPLAVKEGDKVLFGKYAGTDVKLDGKELLMMREEDVLGIIHDSGIVTL